MNKRHFPSSVGRTIIIVALALLVAIGLAQTTGASANTLPINLNDYSSLLKKAAQQGQIRVIATVKSNFAPEGTLGAASVQSQRAAIQQVQNRVIATLTAQQAKYRVITQFIIFPILTLELDQAALQVLIASPDVANVEEDALSSPNDLSTNNVIGAPGAWAVGYDGTGWTVGILDTGVQRTHPFLTGRIDAEACFSTTSAANSSVTLCPNGQSTNGNNPGMSGVGAGVNCDISVPGCDHGTHVAGIAAGRNYAGGPGYDGVARGARIIAIQVFSRFTTAANCGGAPPCVLSYSSDQLAALQYVYTTLRVGRNVASLNMSLGGSTKFTAACDTNPLKPAIDTLRSVNIATVIAAGNNGFTNGISAPGCISTAISVGATNDNDTVASFSNRANFMSLYAPGVNVDSSIPNNTYGSKNGTSMATPHVTGAWAVMKQRFPTASVADILSRLRSTGVSITDSGFTVPRIRLNIAVDVSVKVLDVFTTDAAGTAAVPPSDAPQSFAAAGDRAVPQAIKTAYNAGDPIQFYIVTQNTAAVAQTAHFLWQVTDPLGQPVSSLGWEGDLSTASGTVYWYLPKVIDPLALSGTYTFKGSIRYNGVTTQDTWTFTVRGQSIIFALRAFTTDAAGPSAVASTPVAAPSGQTADGALANDTDFNAGDPILLYFDVYNNESVSVTAFYTWEVLDPLGNHVSALEFSGNVSTPSHFVRWYLPRRVPVDARSGLYTYTARVIYAGKTQFARSQFMVRAISHPDTIGVFRPYGATFNLRNANSNGFANSSVTLGSPSDYPISGDWDGDGIDTVGVYNSVTGVFYLSNSTNGAGVVSYTFAFGSPGGQPIVGDWDGDGRDGVGVFRPFNGIIYLKNLLSAGAPDFTLTMGITGDTAVAGDWNGDGKDSPGIFRPTAQAFYLSNSLCNCVAVTHYAFNFGAVGDVPFVGDWDSNGVSGVGVYRPSTGQTYIRNALTTGPADVTFVFGSGNDYPVAGFWVRVAPPASTSDGETAPEFQPEH